MSATVTVRGLVLRTVDIRESDRLITIYTEEMGAVSALARGARSLKSRQMSATMQFCYGTYVLAKRGEYYWIREAELIESFFDIRKSLEGLALSSYVAEVLSFVATAEADRELLRLSLNTLYAIAEGKHALPKIKAAFEVRLAAALGFMPDVMHCSVCGTSHGDFVLDVMDGSLTCLACRDTLACAVRLPEEELVRERRIISMLSDGAKRAFEYCVFCPLEKLFSFTLPEEDMHLFSKGGETYLVHHLERSFKSLEFYHQLQR